MIRTMVYCAAASMLLSQAAAYAGLTYSTYADQATSMARRHFKQRRRRRLLI